MRNKKSTETQKYKQLVAIARAIDDALNESKDPREVGFMLFTFDYSGEKSAEMNYISNCPQVNTLMCLKEAIGRIEGHLKENENIQ